MTNSNARNVEGNGSIPFVTIVGDIQSNNDVDFYKSGFTTSVTWDQSENALVLTDNAAIRVGTGSDFSILNDATNTWLRNGDNTLYVSSGSNIHLKTNDKESVYAEANGTVKLYFNNSEKLETTSGGLNITCL